MGGPMGQHQKWSHGYFSYPKLEGEIGPHMLFEGKEHLVWSLNNYLGLANHPEVREADAKAAADYGMAYPMGARIMSGNSRHHEELESDLAHFVGKEDAFLLNYGYQGMLSIIDSLADRNDVIVYDAESHACIIDGLRLHMGKRFVYQHNDLASCEKQLARATQLVRQTGGGILLITEGVFGMSGAQGKLKEIVALKQKYNFRILVDDAHGFGTMGKTAQVPTRNKIVLTELMFTSAPLPNQWPALAVLLHPPKWLSIIFAIICVRKYSLRHYLCRWLLA